MKKCSFIIELEFYSSAGVYYYSQNVFGSFYTYKEELATRFVNKGLASYCVLNLARHHYDIKMFEIKRLKH